MFRWYQASGLCYAHIFEEKDMNIATSSGRRNFAECRWFTRGWTLQELVASREIHFYDSKWDFIGTKETMGDLISQVTLIETDILAGKRPLKAVPAVNKMAWASKRVTTRVEDIAYCLFGLFDIHLPIIYGEGSKAFMRLQEEILKSSMDLTLLAWIDPGPRGGPAQEYRGIFARSPREFRWGHRLAAIKNQSHFGGSLIITNQGVQMSGITLWPSLINTALKLGGTGSVLRLQCYDRLRHAQEAASTEVFTPEVGILLQHTMRGYVRLDSDRFEESTRTPGFPAGYLGTAKQSLIRQFHALQDIDADTCDDIMEEADHYIQLRFSSRVQGAYIAVHEVVPAALWDPTRGRLLTAGLTSVDGLVLATGSILGEWPCVIAFRFNHASRSYGCHVKSLPMDEYMVLKMRLDKHGEHFTVAFWAREYESRYAARSVEPWAGNTLQLTATMEARPTSYATGTPKQFTLSIVAEKLPLPAAS